MLRSLLWKSQKVGQLVAACIGAGLGLCILLFSIQTYLDLRSLLVEKEQLIRPEYLVINKPVSLISSFRGGAPSFSTREIAEIKSQEFIKDVASFQNSRFRTYASLSVGSKSMELRTDLFFEAVPGSYVDVEAEKWQWSPGQKQVPIVIPTDYLNLYNFGFAPSQGLPTISPATAEMVSLNLVVYGGNKRETFVGRIVGFSDRLNSILVPEPFLEFANKEFAEEDAKDPSRLILVTEDPSSADLIRFLEEKGYETNQDQLRSGRMNLILTSIFGILAVIGVLLIGLSLLVFLVTFQLIISRNREEIRLLLHLGYPPVSIERLYMAAFSVITVVLGGLALVATMLGRSYLMSVLEEAGFEFEGGISMWLYLALAGIIVLFLGAQWVTVRKGVRGMG